ncbi:hypothetical protein D3C84_823680 [compost metagenome]
MLLQPIPGAVNPLLPPLGREQAHHHAEDPGIPLRLRFELRHGGDESPQVGRLANDFPGLHQIRFAPCFDVSLNVAPDRRGLVGELVRHSLAALFIAQLLRVYRECLDQTTYPLGALTQPDVGIAGEAGGAIFAAAHILLEQGQGELR